MTPQIHNQDATKAATLEAKLLYEQVPETALSFTATVADPMGLGAIPCMLFTWLNCRYFPDCVVGVSSLESDSKAVMRSILSLMMLGAGAGVRVEFRCDTHPTTFKKLRQCICLLFRRSELPGYGKTYDECSKLLQDFESKGPEQLLQELTRFVQLGSRSPLLRQETANADSPPANESATSHSSRQLVPASSLP
jgi:phosphotransferase system HPr-like phosphotransfer protein